MQIKKIYFESLQSLSDALIIRNIRNECRTYLTNDQSIISVPKQINWYHNNYLKKANNNKYRIFLAISSLGQPVGYGALKLDSKRLLVTECVSKKYRGKGFGTAILNNLIKIAKAERLPLIAEIRSDNKASIALHKKCGFVLEGSGLKSDTKVVLYKYVS